jgi:hypothetical protein
LTRRSESEGSEHFFRGFTSPFLAKGNRFGFGILISTDKIVGVRSTRARALILLGPALAAVGGTLFFAPELAFGESSMMVQVFSLAVLPGLGLAVLMLLALWRPLT